MGLCETAVSFTDCVSSAVISSAGGNNSGFVGWSRSSNYAINFTGCLFSGKLLQVGGSGSSNGGFIGWKGDAKTVTITNCLVAPAALADGETMADGSSATFSREHANFAATITNSYYTRALGTAQGKATRTVTVGTGATVSVALSGTQTAYSVSGITAYADGGIQRGTDLYYGSGDLVSLTLGNTLSGAPLGYHYDGYTVTGGTLDGNVLTMPDADVTVSGSTDLRSTREAVTVSYVDASGTSHDAEAIALDGTETSLAAGNYFVGIAAANFDHTVTLGGNVTLILEDGCTMNVGTSESPLTVRGFDYDSGSPSLTIYGQSLEAATAGHLKIYVGNNNVKIGICAGGSYTQHSGNVTIVSTDNGIITYNGDVILNGGTLNVSASQARAIDASGNVSINGGQLDARYTGSWSAKAIYANGTITLGWTNATDRIYASSYSGTVKVATGQALTDDDGNILTGTLATADVNGKTLVPALATITFAPEGFATYYNGQGDATLPAGVKARIVTSNDGNGSLTYQTIADGDDQTANVIPAATAVMLQTAPTTTAQQHVLTLAAPSATAISAPNLRHGSDTETTTTGGSVYYKLTYGSASGHEDLFGWYWGADGGAAFTSPAHKVWLALPAANAGARAFFALPDFGEASGIQSLSKESRSEGVADAWFTLGGHRLNGKPTAKGLYIKW